jgi:hypothetical protein
MYICTLTYIYIHIPFELGKSSLSNTTPIGLDTIYPIYIHIEIVFMCIYMYVLHYVYMYTYIYIYTHTFWCREIYLVKHSFHWIRHSISHIYTYVDCVYVYMYMYVLHKCICIYTYSLNIYTFRVGEILFVKHSPHNGHLWRIRHNWLHISIIVTWIYSLRIWINTYCELSWNMPY